MPSSRSTNLWNHLCSTAWFAPRSRRRESHAIGSLGAAVETCEPRVLPAALCDLSPIPTDTHSVASPGEKIPKDIRIENLGELESPRVRIEIRLSQDDVIDDQDRLLATVTRGKIPPGGMIQWTQWLKLPKDLPNGSYHIGVVIDPDNRIAEQDESNNRQASEGTLRILERTLEGRVRSEGGAKPVEIHAFSLPFHFVPRVDPNLTTWMLIHGRNESSTAPDLVALAQQINGFQEGDQVLVLDWSRAAASGELSGRGENYIRPVAEWAAGALRDYGFSGEQLNLVGYSWGAEVAAEIAEEFGTVNSVLAIDSARDYPGGTYNPEAPGEVNLEAHAENSWGFYSASGLQFGSPIVASTAEHDVVVVGSDHFAIMKVVTSLLALPADNPVAEGLSLMESLLTGNPVPVWQDDSYAATGDTDLADGLFDVLITATANGKAVVSFSAFIDGDEITVEV